LSFPPLTSLHGAAFDAVGWGLMSASDGDGWGGRLGNVRMRDGCWVGRMVGLKLGTFLGQRSIRPMPTVLKKDAEDRNCYFPNISSLRIENELFGSLGRGIETNVS
jgi:hypothetical protein